jgi:hypothetical protein
MARTSVTPLLASEDEYVSAFLDAGQDETVIVKLMVAVPGRTIRFYAGGPGAGHTIEGRRFPDWWPTYPSVLATLTNVGDTYTVTSRVWFEGAWRSGDSSFQDGPQATVTRTR